MNKLRLLRVAGFALVVTALNIVVSDIMIYTHAGLGFTIAVNMMIYFGSLILFVTSYFEKEKQP